MSFMKEFRSFAIKGNMVDMAVGIVIGAAFGGIVTSFVSDVITPPIGLLIGGVDFRDLAVTLKAPLEDATSVTIRYGKFIQTVVDFMIIALAIFLAVKVINSLKREEEAAPAVLSKQEQLLTEIRDLLRERR